MSKSKTNKVAMPEPDNSWQARDDLSTLMRAAEIKKDAKRMAAAKKEAKKQLAALESAAK